MRQEEANHNSSRDYWVFISYSHADKERAKWLHKKLEGYKIPRDLVGMPTRKGAIPRSFHRVFRDEDELSANPNLHNSLYTALDNSQNLVVICSPNSAQSDAVNNEVTYFKNKHGQDRVSCLLEAGVPHAEANGRVAWEECFCPALRFETLPNGLHDRTLSPLAADLRNPPEGVKAKRDYEEAAFLKVVAGILGIGFDDLYKRHRRQRIKKTLAIGGISIFAIAFLVALALRLEEVRTSLQKTTALVNRMDETTHREFGKLSKDRIKYFQTTLESAGIETLFAQVAEEFRLTQERGKLSQEHVRDWSNRSSIYVQKRKELEPKITALLRKLEPQEGWIAFYYQYSNGRMSSRQLATGSYSQLSSEDKLRLKRVWDQSRNLTGLLGEIRRISDEVDETLSIIQGLEKTPPFFKALPFKNGSPQLYNSQPYDLLRAALQKTSAELQSNALNFEEKITFEEMFRQNFPRIMELEKNISQVCGDIWQDLDKTRSTDWKRTEVDFHRAECTIGALENYLIFKTIPDAPFGNQDLKIDEPATRDLWTFSHRLRALLIP